MDIGLCMNVILYVFSYYLVLSFNKNKMPDLKFFSSAEERQKYMKGKKFTWFKTFEYINRRGCVDYVLNYIL